MTFLKKERKKGKRMRKGSGMKEKGERSRGQVQGWLVGRGWSLRESQEERRDQDAPG